MLIVCAERAWVEAELVGRAAGVSVVSGECWGRGGMRGSGCCGARSGDRLLRPRRARCRGCAGTHVLLPDMALLRRQDEVSVIGAAIEAKVAGEGHRRIAGRLGVPADTVRGWLRRFAERAGADQGAFHAVGGRAGSGARGGAAGRERGRGCVGGDRGRGAGVGVAVRAAVIAWRIACVLSGGALLVQHEFPLSGGAVS